MHIRIHIHTYTCAKQLSLDQPDVEGVSVSFGSIPLGPLGTCDVWHGAEGLHHAKARRTFGVQTIAREGGSLDGRMAETRITFT